MNWKALLAVATLVLLIYSPTWVPAASRTLRKTGVARDDIRAQPITDRPNRAGHRHGNSVLRQEPKE